MLEKPCGGRTTLVGLLEQECPTKLRIYGLGVVASAADDTGALSVGALRLLRRLAAAVGGEDMGSKILLTWRAELQHTILQATTGMAQSACGVPRTA